MKNLNPSTSAKPVITELQNLFITLANIDISSDDLKIKIIDCGL